MITAINYAAQAEKGLREVIEVYALAGKIRSSMWIRTLADLIRDSVHFALPDGGYLLDDDLKGLEGQEVRLPYDAITVEYYMPLGEGNSITKRLIIAAETSRLWPDEEDGIAVFSCNFMKGMWVPQCAGAIIQRKWSRTVSPLFLKVLPELFEDESIYDNSETMKAVLSDTLVDCNALLELLEALTCKNVFTPIHQEASKANNNRAKMGKLPIYETKFLAIKVDHLSIVKDTATANGNHASPRQHLRRGHIRRLESGNIWVNSCVVGNSKIGVINKEYRVSKGD
jgi:hypothetical protein